MLTPEEVDLSKRLDNAAAMARLFRKFQSEGKIDSEGHFQGIESPREIIMLTPNVNVRNSAFNHIYHPMIRARVIWGSLRSKAAKAYATDPENLRIHVEACIKRHKRQGDNHVSNH
jgi:hypothetical protein